MVPSKVFCSTVPSFVFAVGLSSCVARPAAEGPVANDGPAFAYASAAAATSFDANAEPVTVTVSPIAVAVALQATPRPADAPTRAVTREPIRGECVFGAMLRAVVGRTDSVKFRAPESIHEFVTPECPEASMSLADPDPGADAYPGPTTMFMWVLGLNWW